MSFLVEGLTTLYAVNYEIGDGGRAAGVITNDKIATQFVVYAKILPTDDYSSLSKNLHSAGQMHSRLVVSMGITDQLCKSMWVGKERYKLEFILPNNKRYSIIALDSDTDAQITAKIASAYAFANNAQSEKAIKMAKITALKALL